MFGAMIFVAGLVYLIMGIVYWSWPLVLTGIGIGILPAVAFINEVRSERREKQAAKRRAALIAEAAEKQYDNR